MTKLPFPTVVSAAATRLSPGKAAQQPDALRREVHCPQTAAQNLKRPGSSRGVEWLSRNRLQKDSRQLHESSRVFPVYRILGKGRRRLKSRCQDSQQSIDDMNKGCFGRPEVVQSTAPCHCRASV